VDETTGPIVFFEHECFTGNSEIRVEVSDDEIKERGQLGVPGPFSCLFGLLINLGEERDNFFWG
jgi:hypothetical protein